MKKLCMLAAAAAAALGLSSVAQAQFLAVVDSTNNRVMTFDPADGTPLDIEFILAVVGGPFTFSTPKEALQVGDEIWVSDQVADAIFRFDINGVYLSTISGGLDNIRGMEFANGVVYVSNSGTSNGAPDDALVMYSPDGVHLGVITGVGDPFDVFEYNGELLVSDIAGEDIRRHAYDGAFLGLFHDSDGINGIDFPQQISTRGGNVIVAGFSAPAGLFEYDPTGVQVD